MQIMEDNYAGGEKVLVDMGSKKEVIGVIVVGPVFVGSSKSKLRSSLGTISRNL